MDKFDPQGMYKIYDMWPTIARDSYTLNYKKINFGEIDHIVFAGMGGSGAIGDVFVSILSKSKIHVIVVKGYHLPSTVNSNTLVIPISVSGNTDETNTILESAYLLNCKIVAFSSGGKMKEFCEKNKINHRTIPLIHSPRASFTSYLYSILNVLHSTFEVKEHDILESLNALENLGKKINSSNLSDNPSLNLAKEIINIPIIYYPFGLQSAAIRFKNSFQENAKIHVMAEDILETCHNGIVSWERDSDIYPILIIGKDDHPKTKERWRILKDYFNQKNLKCTEIISINGNILSKLVCLIYLLDYLTIYKAVSEKIDPSPVKSIDFIKTRLE